MNIIGGRDTLHPFAYAFLSACDYKNTLFSYEINAINEYVKTLVGYNVWDKMVGLYPFVGRTAQLHSINLARPNKYNIWWCGPALTHDAMGVHANGAGFGNTLIALNQFRSSDIHISAYNATYWADANPTDYLIGAADGNAANIIILRTPTINHTYNLGSSGPTGYFGGELTNEQVASQVYGHIIGSKSKICYIQGGGFGNAAPDVASNSNFLIESDWIYNNGCMAPILLFRNGKFGSAGTAFSRATIRMASVGYGLTDYQAALFFEATQLFQAALGRDVERIYLGQSDSLGADGAIVLQSFANLITDTGIMVFGDNIDVASFAANITTVVITGPRVLPISDTPLNTSVDIISFTET